MSNLNLDNILNKDKNDRIKNRLNKTLSNHKYIKNQ